MTLQSTGVAGGRGAWLAREPPPPPLWILCTLHVTLAECERSFSTLKESIFFMRGT